MNDAKSYYNKLVKETIQCPVCDFDSYSKLLASDRYGMGVETVICHRCSLIYINPRPTEGEMANFYRNHYRDFYEGIDVPTKDYIEKGPFKMRAAFVYKALEPYLFNAKNFADIGCAEGTLLSLIEKEIPVLNTFGIEPSIGFGEYAKNNLKGEVFVGTYQEFLKNNPTLNFDVLATTHVLEHILDPVQYLVGLKSLMHHDSILYIEVPNIMNDRVNGIGAVHLGHVLSLDPVTIEILLKKAGFEVVDIFTKNLPALTPAMGVICKISKTDQEVNYPSNDSITLKKDKYLNSIYPKTVSIKRDKKISFFDRLKNKFFK